MSDAFWQIQFKGKPIRLSLNDLSLQRLRECKSRFGQEYGIPTEFISLLLRGDMDAMACAVWIGQQKAGGEVQDPTTMDFTLDDFEALVDPKPAGKKAKRPDPTPAGTTTDDSDETPSSSDTSTSSTSETSSD